MMEEQSAGTAQHRMNQAAILLTYFVSQGTGMEGKVSKITQPQGRSHSGSGPTVYGDRENSKPRGQSWEQPKSR